MNPTLAVAGIESISDAITACVFFICVAAVIITYLKS